MKKKSREESFHLILTGSLLWAGTIWAQTNAWTNSASGYWEQPFWSAGVLPGAGQRIVFTNAWQGLAIGAGTVETHPETLQIEALTVAAPSNSFNNLLLNYAGYDTPLVIGRDNSAGSNAFLGSLVVGSNSAMLILASALEVNNASANVWTERGAFSIGGTFSQGDYATVTAGFLHVGNVGPGVYNLTNGLATVGTEFIGGNFPGRFNHLGGYNQATVVLQAGGEYDLYDGAFGSSVDFQQGTFRQLGGLFNGDLMFGWNGSYLLQGGAFITSALRIPAGSGDYLVPAISGAFLQTGGTNTCQSLTVWGDNFREQTAHAGNYTLTNGSLLVAGPLSVSGGAVFSQSGGFQTNTGVGVSAVGGYSYADVANFLLSGGMVMTPLLSVGANYAQSGGTNLTSTLGFVGARISNQFPIGNYQDVGSFSLSGGFLACSNASVDTGTAGTFSQSGGILQVTNLLSITGGYPSRGYGLSGGQLIARDISLTAGGAFRHSGGAVVNSGLITLAEGNWVANTNQTDLGWLVLSRGASNSASQLTLPLGAAVIRFRDSSSIAWSNQAGLTIDGWNGSYAGGGHHQIFFGNNSATLTPQQLSQIQFHNPAGMNGTLMATIRPTGEIVPPLRLDSQRSSAGLVLTWPAGATLQTANNVMGPYSDAGC